MPEDEIELDLPSFMQTKEYDERVRNRNRQLELEYERIDAERRYRLERRAEARRIRDIRRKKVRAVKIVLLGLTVTIVGSSLVSLLFKEEVKANPTNEPYAIIDVQEPGIEIEDRYKIGVTPSPTPEVEIINIDLSYEARKASIDPRGQFAVGSEVNSYILNVLNNSEAYPLFLKYGEMYGVDPYILIAKAFQESSFKHNACLPGGQNYNGYGVGIMQHESPDGRAITAHNYQTGEEDIVYLTMEAAVDLETNIKAGAMHFQNCLENNNGNILLALQNYNYGDYMMHSILSAYSKLMGKSIDEIKSDYDDSGWMELVRDAHKNPTKYIGNNWRGSYGDDDYIKNVLRYFIGSNTHYRYGNTRYVFDLNTLEAIEVTPNVNVVK